MLRLKCPFRMQTIWNKNFWIGNDHPPLPPLSRRPSWMLPFKKNGKRLASHVSWQQEAFQSDDVGASSIRFRLNDSHRYTPILSSHFHFLEYIDISNVYVVFSFHD